MPEGYGPDPETGEFERPFVDTLNESLREGVKERADGPIDLSPGSPFGSIVDSVSDEAASVWEGQDAIGG